MKRADRDMCPRAVEDLQLRRDPERPLAFIDAEDQRRAATDREPIGDADLHERHQDFVHARDRPGHFGSDRPVGPKNSRVVFGSGGLNSPFARTASHLPQRIDVGSSCAVTVAPPAS